MEKLTILLACANSDSAPLEAVKKERDTLIRIFDQVVNQETNGLLYKEEASFDVETLIKAIRTYEKTLHIFHFAGHANGTALKLDDDPAFSEGVARLLEQAPKLKLVFLNGCATKGHVAQLMKTGVAAVIATSSKIPDRLAQLFSEYFYQALISDKRSLLVSFDYAKENIQVIEKNEILDARWQGRPRIGCCCIFCVIAL
jgi:CHAT domain-containing protein